jgi:hypothetical protein
VPPRFGNFKAKDEVARDGSKYHCYAMRCLKYLRRVALVAVLPVILPGIAPAETNDLAIYIDRMVNGFIDWSFASRNLMSTNQIYAGNYSISVNAKAWEGLYFRRAAFINTTDYRGISFWVHGGDQGGQVLLVRPVLGGQAQSGEALPALLAGQWQKITVPFITLNAANRTNFEGFQIQLCAGITDTFYVDNIQLDAKAAAPVAESAIKLAPLIQTEPVVKNEPDANRMVLWIVGSLAVIIVLLGCLVLLFWRRSPASERVVHSDSALMKPSGSMAANPDQEWKQRALTAEAMAGKQGQMLREKIMPELTEFAKQSLVQGLYAQRNALIETQQKAQQALQELESRLTALQLPLRERISAYEKRIVELEKEIETQADEVRELNRATLALVRRKLEDERKNERTQNRFN